MKSIKRWLPLIGTAALVACVVLRMTGHEDLARVVEQAGGLTGITTNPTVPLAEIAAAAAAIAGVALKVKAELGKPSI